MLNRVCTGSSSLRLRYRMMHQKIRPHTKKPTTRAAIVDAIHMSYIRCACRLIPGPGHPKWPKAPPTSSMEQPASRSGSITALTPSPASRPARGRAVVLFTPTCSCLPCSATVVRTGHRRQGVTDGRTLLDLALPCRSGVRSTPVRPAYPGHPDDTVLRV